MKRVQRLNLGRRGLVLCVGALGAFGLVAGACGGDDDAGGNTGERTIYFQATELDSLRLNTQTAFPKETRELFPNYFGAAEKPTENGGASGYYLFQANETQWRVGSYMFLPPEVVAYKGQQLTFEILGVRGDEHKMLLVDPSGATVKGTDGKDVNPTLKRGGLVVFKFEANETGLYTLTCATHAPTMSATIHVLKP